MAELVVIKVTFVSLSTSCCKISNVTATGASALVCINDLFNAERRQYPTL
jgi:predicted rRNA methylase YqxC with S4 and FtsJ domains